MRTRPTILPALVLAPLLTLGLGVMALGGTSGCSSTRAPARRGGVDAAPPASPRATGGAPTPPGATRPDASRPGPRAATAATVDHAPFDRLLRAYVSKGRVNYGAWGKALADVKALEAYLGGLATVDPGKLSAPGRFAFWINAYNASVIRGVLEALAKDPGYSVSKDGFVFFEKRRYRVAGLTLSLNALENGVLRGQLEHKHVKPLDAATKARIRAYHAQVLAPGQTLVDPRFHFALVCAARGCPELRAEAYTAARLETQLVEQTRAFVNDPVKGASPKGISALFHWYAPDFAGPHGSAKAFVTKHYQGDASRLAFDKELPYSWVLNKP